MENAIPALVIGAILLIASSFVARGSLQTYDQLGAGIKSLESRLGEQSRTRLSLSGATLDPGLDTLTLTLSNDGQSRIANFDDVDVIVTYFSGPSTQTSTWMPYTTGVPTANSWTVASIANDSFEPGILNPGETASIEIEISPAVEAGKTNLIVIGSEHGIIISSPFSS